MAVIHVVGADHDSSIGEAAHYQDKDFFDCLFKMVKGADLVYTADDSLRQDLCGDLFNRLVNLYFENGIIDDNGSIFISIKIMRNYLLEKGISAKILTTTTTDVFNNNPSGTHYEEAAKAAITEHLALLKKAVLQFGGARQLNIFQVLSFLNQHKIKHTTCLDQSKFLNVWLKIQEVALMHPEDTVIYHFADDKKAYGDDLVKLFTAHPELLPKNVSFVFEHCDYFKDRFFRHTSSPPVQGKGVAYADHRQRLVTCARMCVPATQPLIGNSIDGSSDVLNYDATRSALTQAKPHTASMTEDEAKAQPTPIAAPAPTVDPSLNQGPATATSSQAHLSQLFSGAPKPTPRDELKAAPKAAKLT